jgi:class 3 adenylate cyclase
VFQIGINLGDVVVEGEDLPSDGVNVAARLEQTVRRAAWRFPAPAYDHMKKARKEKSGRSQIISCRLGSLNQDHNYGLRKLMGSRAHGRLWAMLWLSRF